MIYERLRNRIKDHEGYRQFPYLDSLGYWTVGYGHLIEETDAEYFGQTIGEILDAITKRDQHERWLNVDIHNATHDAKKFVGHNVWIQLSDERQEVLVEMAFQLGYSKILQFRKFKAAILRDDFTAAAAEMLDSRWNQQTPNRVYALSTIMQSDKIA